MKTKELHSYEKYKADQIFVSNYGRGDRFSMMKSSLIETLSLTKDSFILDIGCRRGEGVREFLDDGYKNTYGIDIGTAFIKQDKHDNNFMSVDAHDTLGFDHKYDLISIIHTLEHAYDASKMLSLISNHLTEDGILYVVVPHGEITNPAHYFACEHVDDLNELFEQANLEVVDSVDSHQEQKVGKHEYSYFCRRKNG